MRRTIIFAIFPSSCASTSIWALSVSISSKTSPVENESPVDPLMSLTIHRLHKVFLAFPLPSFTFQLAMFPSVIVGDIAGIVKFCAARDFEVLRNPSMEFSSLSIEICSGKSLLGRLTNLEMGHCETTTEPKALQRLYMLLKGKPFPF